MGAGRTGDFLGLGIAFSRQDKVGEAKWALGPEAELVPDSLEIRFELGKILLGEEDFAGAIEQFSRLVEIDSGNAAARINLAIALSRSGESDNARATLWRGPPAESRQS